MAETPATANSAPESRNSYDREDTQISDHEPIPRRTYEPPTDPELRQRMNIFESYVRKHGLQDKFSDMCSVLMDAPDLPYNPYPIFAKRFRSMAQRFHMIDRSIDEILAVIDRPFQFSSTSHITHPIGCNFIWGLSSIIKSVDPSTLQQYKRLVEEVTPPIEIIDCPDGYTVQINPALVGRTVFHGTFYERASKIQVRLEYVVAGPDVNEATELFTKGIIKDLRHNEKEGIHITLGANVPISNEENNKFATEYWDINKVYDCKDEFWSLLNKAVAASKIISVEYLFKLDRDSTVYVRGEKQYCMNFLQTDSGQFDKDRLTSFSEYPLMTLHEGVFMKKVHAETYFSIFEHQLAASEEDDLSFVRVPPSSGTSQPASRHVPTSNQKRRTFNEKFHDKFKTASKTTPAKTDGFYIGANEKHDAPSVRHVTASVKSHWQKKIANLNEKTKMMDITHFALLLALMDRDTNGFEVLFDIYRLTHSLAGKLYESMQENKQLEDFIFAMKDTPDQEGPVILQMYRMYASRLEKIFFPGFTELSCDLETYGKSLSSMLKHQVTQTMNDQNSIQVDKKTVDKLRALNHYCMTLLISLYGDCCSNCPKLMGLVDYSKEAFPEEVPRLPNKSSFNTYSFVYGVEDSSIMKHECSMVNVKAATRKNGTPPTMSVDSVLIKYVLDTRLDETWQSFLMELSTNTYLPPNPYPRLVSNMRQCAMRMDLLHESSEKILKRVLYKGTREMDPGNFIYHTPGCEAHGHSSALSLLDTGNFFHLAPVARKFVNNSYPDKKGNFKIVTCTALTNFTPWYGQMSPYLLNIDLHENCYMSGPPGGSEEAVQIYASLVVAYVKEVSEQQELLITGVYLGHLEERWNLTEILSKPKVFQAEFERHCFMKEPIYIKAYVKLDWQYTPVEKQFCLHYFENSPDFNECERYYPTNNALLYLNVFFEKEKAAFHFQYGGPPDNCSPYSASNVRDGLNSVNQEILNAVNRADWINVHRWLTVKSLMKRSNAHVADTWRMLHSVASRVEYIQALNTSLQDLIQYVLEFKESHLKKPDEGEDVLEDDYPDDNEEDAKEPPGLQTATLTRMAMAFHQKVIEVVKSQISLLPTTVGNLLQNKLLSLVKPNTSTREKEIDISSSTIVLLSEVCNVLKPVQDSTSYDVHCICHEAVAAVRSIRAESGKNPRQFNKHVIEESANSIDDVIMKPAMLHY